MAQRKIQQEIDKTFKKVAEGIQVFDGILEKIDQASNASQKDKLEDALKREIKKLQRLRDQIKTWAAGNEIKDKKPLMEQRKNIESCMEKFKAVEKEMKTKAFSKEGLNAPGKRDPKEQEKEEIGQFLSDMIGELERQIETLEAEEEQLQATVKKGKKDPGKADRLQEITRKSETHRFHIGKLELLRRALENGNVETEKVQEKKEEIEYYVNDNMSVDFMEEGTDEIYDDLNLEEDEGAFGPANDNDHVSSQDAQSTAGDIPEGPDRGGASSAGAKPKSSSVSESQSSGGRRPSNAHKSPLPALATLHTPLPSVASTAAKDSMKPAPLPTRPPGETLKYASAAAAAATASDKTSMGIAPLPPPPSSLPPPPTTTAPAASAAAPMYPTAPYRPPGLGAPVYAQKGKSTSSPEPLQVDSGDASSLNVIGDPEVNVSKSKVVPSQPITAGKGLATNGHDIYKSSELGESSSNGYNSAKPPSATSASVDGIRSSGSDPATGTSQVEPPSTQQANDSRAKSTGVEESIYHLPHSLQEMVTAMEFTISNPKPPGSAEHMKDLAFSHVTKPQYLDSERPSHYRPDTKFKTPSYYPQDPFNLADDPNLYSKVDTDTLFYIFYYRQGTYSQLLAARALKAQSWRFHKQYQTWFQRHEEPKVITEEYEQGTYRFFDYESTWMNRRKADFKFHYKFLEDDI